MYIHRKNEKKKHHVLQERSQVLEIVCDEGKNKLNSWNFMFIMLQKLQHEVASQ